MGQGPNVIRVHVRKIMQDSQLLQDSRVHHLKLSGACCVEESPSGLV